MCHNKTADGQRKNTDPFKQIFLDAKGKNSLKSLDGECEGQWDGTWIFLFRFIIEDVHKG
jgi:hypothetical protein